MRKNTLLFVLIAVSVFFAACGDNYEPGVLHRQLDYVFNIQFDYDTKTLSWDPVENAIDYLCYIDNGTKDGFLPKITKETHYTYTDDEWEDSEYVSFVVKALGYTSKGVEYETSLSYSGYGWRIYLFDESRGGWLIVKEPSNISYNRETGKLTWDTSEFKNGNIPYCFSEPDYFVIKYTLPRQSEITISQQITSKEYDFGNLFKNIEKENPVNATPITFTIQARSNNKRVQIPDEKEYISRIPLAKPVIRNDYQLTLNNGYLGGSISWNKVPNATGYYVNVSVRYSNNSYFSELAATQIKYSGQSTNAGYVSGSNSETYSVQITHPDPSKKIDGVYYTITTVDWNHVWGSSTYDSRNP